MQTQHFLEGRDLASHTPIVFAWELSPDNPHQYTVIWESYVVYPYGWNREWME